jgi:hypothetical protein
MRNQWIRQYRPETPHEEAVRAMTYLTLLGLCIVGLCLAAVGAVLFMRGVERLFTLGFLGVLVRFLK